MTSIDYLRLGVLPNAPFAGWAPTCYGIAAGIGGWGILAGVLGLFGKRATWPMRLAVLLVAAGLGGYVAGVDPRAPHDAFHGFGR